MKKLNYPENKAVETRRFGGFTAAVVLHERGHYCGYVRFARRPVIEVGYSGILDYVPVHGGITYAKQQGRQMVYGFDCCHCDDLFKPPLRDIEWLFSECERMGNAIKIAAKFERRYLLAKTNKGKAAALDAFHAKAREAGAHFNLSDNFMATIHVLAGDL